MGFKEMKAIGSIRKVGKEGRICLPRDVRKAMGIYINDLVEQTLYEQENGELVLVIRKYKKL